MKKTLNLRRLLPLALLLAFALTCGTVYAYMFERTDEKTVVFAPAKVSCEVNETFDGTQKSNVTVENTGNVSAYLRVRLVTYWVTSDDKDDKKVVAANSPALPITPANGWIKGNQGDDDTYYYTSPVAAGASTPALFAGSITRTLLQDNGYEQVVDVFAEAIQAEPADAVTSSWGATLDDDRVTISSAP